MSIQGGRINQTFLYQQGFKGFDFQFDFRWRFGMVVMVTHGFPLLEHSNCERELPQHTHFVARFGTQVACGIRAIILTQSGPFVSTVPSDLVPSGWRYAWSSCWNLGQNCTRGDEHRACHLAHQQSAAKHKP